MIHILGETIDEFFGANEYDPYDPFEGETEYDPDEEIRKELGEV